MPLSSKPEFRPGGLLLDSVPFVYPSAKGEETLSNSNLYGGKKQGHVDLAEIEKRERQAWSAGVQEGESKARVQFETHSCELRASIEKSLLDFIGERNNYFERVEAEVVQLSLAIASKILHRESQIDPLLLAGLVHVALERVGAQTKVRLRVNPSELEPWRKFFAPMAGQTLVPELVGDESLELQQCVIETEHGSTEVSLETHLKEIEQGFFDLLARRPRNP